MSASERRVHRVLSTRRQAVETDAAQYRYGVVFILIVTSVVFVIVAPEGSVSLAVTFGIVGAALVVAVSTSRERSEVRRRRAIYGSAIVLIITVATAVGFLPQWVTHAFTVIFTLAIPAALARGLLRLLREQGATFQAVAGALAIYLLIGLAFASAVGFVAAVSSRPFFAETAASTASERVYYSFTVLTTTGFGDLTAAHGVGRALAVLEMLTGQLYLVTVIALVIGRRLDTTR